MGINVTEKSISELLGLPTDISELDITKRGSFAKVAFNLYRETAIVTIVVSHLCESANPTELSLSRNQAIEAGLAVRITKYMGAILALQLDKVREHGEVIMSLNRCISESAVNLMFFAEKATDEDYDEFVKSSLKPERNQYRLIQENIARRGKELPIETRILSSINRTFENSGVKSIDELNKIPKRKNYEEILRILEMDSAYPMLQGVPSHSIHGTWVDLVSHHLEKMGSGFRPHPESVIQDPRLFCPISILVLYAMRSYVNKNFPATHKGIAALLARIEDLIERDTQVDALHEDSLSR